MKPRRLLYWAMLAVLAVAGSALAYWYTSTPHVPTAEEYLGRLGAKGKLLGGGQLDIDGVKARCGERPTILDPTLNDIGAANPGYIILNPGPFAKLPTVVKLYAFYHECGHQVHGPSEEQADCYAVETGKHDGWLDVGGIQKICDFWKPYAGDSVHLPGPARCELMKQCFAAAKPPGG